MTFIVPAPDSPSGSSSCIRSVFALASVDSDPRVNDIPLSSVNLNLEGNLICYDGTSPPLCLSFTL